MAPQKPSQYIFLVHHNYFLLHVHVDPYSCQTKGIMLKPQLPLVQIMSTRWRS